MSSRHVVILVEQSIHNRTKCTEVENHQDTMHAHFPQLPNILSSAKQTPSIRLYVHHLHAQRHIHRLIHVPPHTVSREN